MALINKHTITVLFIISGLTGSLGCSSGEDIPAPPFTLMLMTGENVSSKELLGKVYLLNFWMTDCLPCNEELTDFNKLYTQYDHDENFTIISVALDDDLQVVQNYIDAGEVIFPIAVRNKTIEYSYQLKCLPTTFVINKKGMIVMRYNGKPDFNDLKSIVKKELKK